MKKTDSLFNKNLPPLAERVRPKTIDNFIGQDHLIGPNKIINQMLSKRKYYSIILWGPPGSGKTTLARIIAKSTESIMYEISAVSSGVKDIRNIIDKASTNNDNGINSIMFIDEIHRFSKSQQDALLHAVEGGIIVLIGATTENPSFEIINPLLSRCKTLKLKPLNDDDLHTILNQTIKSDILLSQKNIIIDKSNKKKLIHYCSGDARKMLNAFEIALDMCDENNLISDQIINEVLQSRTLLYDKNSDYHYDTISAFIKSVRGSDPDAALYWFSRMLAGGEDPHFIARRMTRMAAEDIGLADPNALPQTIAAWEAYERLGSPEGELALAQALLYLATAPKSNAAYVAFNQAKDVAKKTGSLIPPKHILNAPTSLMKKEGYGTDYIYDPDTPESFSGQEYFPEELKRISFYHPVQRGFERDLQKRLEYWKKLRQSKKRGR